MAKRILPVKINLKGGMITAVDLLAIAQIAEDAGVKNISFGSRQQLYVKGTIDQCIEMLKPLEQLNLCVEMDEQLYPNIVSSYVVQDIFQQQGTWPGESLYQDILDSFQYKPTLKINIVDNGQCFAPFFTGNLNFIASTISNYWYLQVRFPKSTIIFHWPELIYSFDIHRISKVIEAVIRENEMTYTDQSTVNGDSFFKAVMERESFLMHAIPQPLKLPEFMLPYYEGFNKYADRYWLGIYSRDELFSIDFIKELCKCCIQHKIGQLHITPWKSIIIKNIEQRSRKVWDLLLGKFRINVRHASNELNWQVEDLSEEAIQLKKYLVGHFNREDLRTFGLCFAIKIRPHTGLFGSVIIRKQLVDQKGRKISKDRYGILYTRDFNPNSKDLVLFRDNIVREDLVPYLVSLCKYYYEKQVNEAGVLHQVFQEKHIIQQEAESDKKQVYECGSCLSLYDENYGDELQGIVPGLSFTGLPENYCCGVCGEGKENFKSVIKNPVVTG